MTKNLNKKDLLYFLVSGILYIAVMIFGIFFLTTSNLKGLQNDSLRVSDFDTIKYNSQLFAQKNHRLPKDLKELDESQIGTSTSYYRGNEQRSIYKDPKTKDYYEYKAVDDNTYFEICTTFETASTEHKSEFPDEDFDKGYDCLKKYIDSYYLNQY